MPCSAGAAALNLERDRAIDIDALADEDEFLASNLLAAAELPEDPTGWEPASYSVAMRVMGHDVPPGMGGDELGGVFLIPALCEMPFKSRIEPLGLPDSLSAPEKAMATAFKRVCGGVCACPPLRVAGGVDGALRWRRCCGGACCEQGQICCGGNCCEVGQKCCAGKCCSPETESCCNGECCEGPCCNGICCAAGGTCCGDGCCPAGADCCNPELQVCCLLDEKCCGNHCCPSASSCCGSGCCPLGTYCCNANLVVCCVTGTRCCVDHCCPAAYDCCSPGCCPPGEMCCGGTTCCAPADCCNEQCCSSNETCCNSGRGAGGGPVCAGASCSLMVDGTAAVCPGGTVDLTLVAVCQPDCRTMGLESVIVEPEYQPFASVVMSPAGVYCGPVKSPVNVSIAILPGAPPGVMTVRITGQVADDTDILCGTTSDVQVTVVQVSTAYVDATDPHAAKVNYHIDPHNVTIDSATFSAPGTVETRANLAGDFSFVFDQKDLVGGDNQIRLEYSVGTSTCHTEATATRTTVHAPPRGTIQEVASFRVPVDNGLATVPVLHSIWGQFAFICYSVGALPGSKTLWVGTSKVNISTEQAPGMPTEIQAWAETHLYRDVYGEHLRQPMVGVTGPTIPMQGPHFRSMELDVDAFFAPNGNLTSVGEIYSLFFDDPSGPILAIPFLNTAVDLPLETNADPGVSCP